MRVGGCRSSPISRRATRSSPRRSEKLAGKHHAVLLANHGPVVAGSSLANAQYATEELEETAKLFLLLRSHKIRPLTPDQVADLRARFKL